MSVHRLLPLLLVAVAASVLVGCGGDAVALDPVASAATTTAKSDTARIAFNATIEMGQAGTMQMLGKGVYDGRARTGWMNMSYSLPQSAQAQLGGNPSMEMIFDGHDGLVMYMRSSLFRQLAGDKWVKLDLEKIADKQGLDLGALMNANQADPSQALGMLKASSDARVVGTDTIRGVRTTRYSLRVDLHRVADENKALRDSLQQVIDATGIDSYPAEAWVDAQGRVRRLKVEMSMSMPGAGAMKMTMVEDLYGFGAHVNVLPPPDDQVVDLSQLGG
jgi:hypothetical protein